ncbi:hypothetical protein Btru_062119 [Bulinus truncatus]|nr:hypothetical protein Btru_062119 [Bulinus truncatus]
MLFRPLKQARKEILKRWFKDSHLQKVSKEVFPCLVKQLMTSYQKKMHKIVSSVKPVEVSQRPEISASNMASEAFTPMLSGQPNFSHTKYIETSSKTHFNLEEKENECRQRWEKMLQTETDTLNVIVGDWVLVKYTGKKIIHELKTPDDGLYTVKFLTKSQVGPYYVFPEKDDIASFNIVKKLPRHNAIIMNSINSFSQM